MGSKEENFSILLPIVGIKFFPALFTICIKAVNKNANEKCSLVEKKSFQFNFCF